MRWWLLWCVVTLRLGCPLGGNLGASSMLNGNYERRWRVSWWYAMFIGQSTIGPLSMGMDKATRPSGLVTLFVVIAFCELVGETYVTYYKTLFNRWEILICLMDTQLICTNLLKKNCCIIVIKELIIFYFLFLLSLIIVDFLMANSTQVVCSLTSKNFS